MRHNNYAYVVLGFKCKRSEIYVEKSFRGCYHDVDLTANFCPICGQPIYTNKQVCLLNEDRDPINISYFFTHDTSDEVVVGIEVQRTIDIVDFEIPTYMSKRIMSFITDHSLPYLEEHIKPYLILYYENDDLIT